MDLRHAPRPTFWRYARRSGLAAAVAVLLPTIAGAQALDAFSSHSVAPKAPKSISDSIVAVTRSLIGVRYRYGGESPQRGFDCSGLLKYIMGRFDLELPRTAKAQATLGAVVERDTSQLRPGDVLLFSGSERGPVTHIGIYVGGGRFVHASSVAKKVIEVPLNRPPAPRIKLWNGVRRIPLAPEEPADEPWPTPER